jgi:cation:H+ antiporter
MILTVFLLITGFVILIAGANFLVSGAGSLARRLHVPELVIGLTIVAFGTSAPEMVVSLIASADGMSEVVLGNVIGSNIFNLLLILGISGAILPILVQSKTVWIEIPLSLLAALLLLIMAHLGVTGEHNQIDRIEGSVLLLCFAGFLFYVFRNLKKEQPNPGTGKIRPLWMSIVTILTGLAGLVAGGQLVVSRSVEIASLLGMSEKLIGLTIVSIGTSLPELATSVVAAIRKNSDIAIGNIVGSNIFNILLILGLSSVIRPVTYTLSFDTDLGILSAATLLLFIAMFTGRKHKLDRWEAALLVVGFALYMVFIIQRN